MTEAAGGSTRLVEDPWERAWMLLTLAVLGTFVGALLIATAGFGIHLPGSPGRVDPKTVTEQGPFASPGLAQTGAASYTVHIVARAWAFDPPGFTVPLGSEVTFRMTSVDVQHGFKLAGTNVNTMVIPGRITELTHTFEDAGEFTYVCTEYCGTGHARMFGSVKVVPPGETAGGGG